MHRSVSCSLLACWDAHQRSTWAYVTQLVLGSILLAPIRFVLILLLMLLAQLIVKVALIGLSVRDIHDKPFAPWRKNLLLVVRCVSFPRLMASYMLTRMHVVLWQGLSFSFGASTIFQSKESALPLIMRPYSFPIT